MAPQDWRAQVQAATEDGRLRGEEARILTRLQEDDQGALVAPHDLLQQAAREWLDVAGVEIDVRSADQTPARTPRKRRSRRNGPGTRTQTRTRARGAKATPQPPTKPPATPGARRIAWAWANPRAFDAILHANEEAIFEQTGSLVRPIYEADDMDLIAEIVEGYRRNARDRPILPAALERARAVRERNGVLAALEREYRQLKRELAVLAREMRKLLDRMRDVRDAAHQWRRELERPWRPVRWTPPGPDRDSGPSR